MRTPKLTYQRPENGEHVTGLIDAFGDVGEDGEIRRAAHKLFGRMYVPRAVSSHDALNDKPFQDYLKRLIDGLHKVAQLRERVRTLHPQWYGACSGQAVTPEIFLSLRPEPHGFKVLPLRAGNTLGKAGAVQEFIHWKWWFAFSNPDLMPLDEAWVMRNGCAYSEWEKNFGEARWIEHLIPSLPRTLGPDFVDHLVTAKGSKPSGRWTKQLATIIEERESDYRSGVLTMLERFGSADDVKASEAAWKEAGVYAFLHLEYRRVRRSGHEPATKSLPDLLYLPWIKEGRTVLHNGLPANPITLSDSNTVFARGLVWAASFWRDTEMIDALAVTAGGAMQPLDLGDQGMRMRSLAVFNACVWSLSSNGSADARRALEALLRVATDSRARKCLEAGLSATPEF